MKSLAPLTGVGQIGAAGQRAASHVVMMASLRGQDRVRILSRHSVVTRAMENTPRLRHALLGLAV